LSSFSNCIGKLPEIARDELTIWKTDRDIGLGSSAGRRAKDIRKTTEESKIEGTKYRWIIHGDLRDGHYLKDDRPELGDAALVYRGRGEDFRASMFGIRKGKVVWSYLSRDG